MKKTATLFILMVFLSIYSISGVSASGSSAPVRQVSGNSITVSFETLGYSDSNMVGPVDSTRKIFSVPPNWSLVPGGAVDIAYDVVFSGADAALITGTGSVYAGTLTIYYNTRIIGQIRLDQAGSFSQRFQIPAEAVASVRENGEHELNIRLIAQSDCEYSIRTFVTVKSISHFELPFEITPPVLDLARLPAPFYASNSLLPDRTILVISDTPSIEEIKGALNVMAGFGSMAGGSFDIVMDSMGNMTMDMLTNNNLIFVGTPEDFPVLENANFPLRITGGKFADLPPASATDGVIQLSVSPLNPNKVVMLVSGTTDEGVTKAATAVSSGRLFVYQNPQIVYVSEIQDLESNLPLVEFFTLHDLGYENETLQGVGLEEIEYSFFVSKDQVPSKDGVVTLAYYHSGLLNYGISSLNVLLNGEPIASQPFSEESEQITYLPIKIPPGILRYGENRIVMSTSLEPDLSCDVSGLSDPWITISNQTSVQIPAGDSVEDIRSNLLDLKFFPAMFMKQSDLGDLAFILPQNDPTSWKVAGNLAFSLGETVNPILPNIAAAYADNVPDSVRLVNSMIIIGKPSTVPLLAEFNDSLPAPFDFETNTANEKQMQIIYRVPPGVNVGYLELIASPFNSGSIILIASGNTDTGVAMAGDALVNEQFKDRLAGQLAVTNGIQVAVGNGPSQFSIFSIVGTVVPPSNQIVTTPLPDGQSPSGYARPTWLVPLLVASGIIVLMVIAYVVFRSLVGSRTRQLELTEEEKTEIQKNNNE